MENYAMKARKNKRRIDPRYHLDETIEKIEEESNAVRQDKMKRHMKDYHDFSFDSWLNEGADKGTPSWDDDEEESEEGHIDYEKGKIGGKVFEESEALEEITIDMRSPNVGEDDEELEDFPGGTIADLPDEVVDVPASSCGAGKEDKLYFVDLGLLGKLEARNLKGAVDFALHALKNDLEIADMSAEVAAAVQGLSESDDLEEG